MSATLPDCVSLFREQLGRRNHPKKPNTSWHRCATGLWSSEDPSPHLPTPNPHRDLPPWWEGPALLIAWRCPRGGVCPYRHPWPRRVVRRAPRSASGHPRERALIGRQTSLNINGLGVMFIAVTRGGTGLPPAFGKEGGEGRAGAGPTVPAGGEGWAPRAACPCPSPPSPSHCQPCRASPPAAVTSRGMGSNTGRDCLLLERSGQHAPSSQPGTESVPRPGQHLRASTEPSRGPAAPRHGDVRGASLPAVGTGMLRPSPGGASPGPGGASRQEGCAIQFALISPSASGSHAPTPINAGVAGGKRPRGTLPLAGLRSADTRSPRQPGSGATGCSQAPGGCCVGPSQWHCWHCCHGALAALSIRRTGAPAA